MYIRTGPPGDGAHRHAQEMPGCKETPRDDL